MTTYCERGRFRGGVYEKHLRVKKRMEPECAHNYFILRCLGAIKKYLSTETSPTFTCENVSLDKTRRNKGNGSRLSTSG